jgi:hypothetical protein
MFQNLEDGGVAFVLGWELFNVKVEPDARVPASKCSDSVAGIGKPGD